MKRDFLQKPGDLFQKTMTLFRSTWNAFQVWRINFKKNTPTLRPNLKVEIAEFPLEGIYPINQKAYLNYIELLGQKAFGKNTRNRYKSDFVNYLKILKSISVDSISPEQLKSYFLYCLDTLKLSEHTVDNRLHSIRYYYEQVLHQKKYFLDIPRPQRSERMHKTLNKKEIIHLIANTNNIKHKLILQFIYGVGLQVQEMINLKIADIDERLLQVYIRAHNGKKNRYVQLPDSILSDLRAYLNEYNPKKYLFEGKDGGQYALRSVQAVLKTTINRANIKKRVGVYGLRQSYAKHLTASGVDMKFKERLSLQNPLKIGL